MPPVDKERRQQLGNVNPVDVRRLYRTSSLFSDQRAGPQPPPPGKTHAVLDRRLLRDRLLAGGLENYLCCVLGHALSLADIESLAESCFSCPSNGALYSQGDTVSSAWLKGSWRMVVKLKTTYCPPPLGLHRGQSVGISERQELGRDCDEKPPYELWGGGPHCTKCKGLCHIPISTLFVQEKLRCRKRCSVVSLICKRESAESQIRC